MRDEIIEKAVFYLLSRVKDGICSEFYQIRHGPSVAWTTAGVGSTLAEFEIILQEMMVLLM